MYIRVTMLPTENLEKVKGEDRNLEKIANGVVVSCLWEWNCWENTWDQNLVKANDDNINPEEITDGGAGCVYNNSTIEKIIFKKTSSAKVKESTKLWKFSSRM